MCDCSIYRHLIVHFFQFHLDSLTATLELPAYLWLKVLKACLCKYIDTFVFHMHDIQRCQYQLLSPLFKWRLQVFPPGILFIACTYESSPWPRLCIPTLLMIKSQSTGSMRSTTKLYFQSIRWASFIYLFAYSKICGHIEPAVQNRTSAAWWGFLCDALCSRSQCDVQ